MDLFHIKVFEKPRSFLSIIYLIDRNIHNSHFIKVEACRNVLYNPGKNPTWISNVIELQKNDIQKARKYVVDQLKMYNNGNISVGFSWGESDYHNDKFINEVLMLAGFEE